MHVNSLFKFSEAPDVAAQLDDLLSSRSTVLDHTHPGLITCKLERKPLHGDRVFWSECYVNTQTKTQHFCAPPILTNYIHTGRSQSLERHKTKFQKPGRVFFIHTFNFEVCSQGEQRPTSLKNNSIFWNVQHSPTRSNKGYPTEFRQTGLNIKYTVDKDPE